MMARSPEVLAVFRLRVENASCISSHLTWGFPSPTAFVGFGHALERRLRAQGVEVNVVGVGVVCHQFSPQVEPAGYNTLQLSLARHPLDADGGSPALVEEGKAHLDVSVLLGLSGAAVHEVWPSQQHVSPETQAFLDHLYRQMLQMRLAGGSVFAHRSRPVMLAWQDEDPKKQSRKLYRRLLPAFALVDRRELLATHQTWLAQHPPFVAEHGDTPPTRLDSLLDLVRLNLGSSTPDRTAEAEAADDTTSTDAASSPVRWQIRSRPAHQKGWLVPVPLGYGALTELQPAGSVDGARDQDSPVAFVESLLGLGEWVSPHRITNLAALLWAYHPDTTQGVYHVYQPFAQAETAAAYLPYTNEM